MKSKPWKVEQSRLYPHWAQLPNGTHVLYLMSHDMAGAIGHIQFRHALLNCTEILYIFVHERCRRQRLAMKMLDWLQDAYPSCVVATAQGNELSTPWLKACGFATHPVLGWYKPAAASRPKGKDR